MDLSSLLELDARLTGRLRIAEQPGRRQRLFAFLAHSGDSWFWAAGLAVVAVVGDSFWRPWALVLLVSILVLAGGVLGLKFLIRRRRPEGEWGRFYRSTDPHSFPSGHAARALLLAVLVSGLGPPWLAAVLWVWAPLVSLARVAMGLHYLSDVLAGALLGLVAGLAVLQFT